MTIGRNPVVRAMSADHGSEPFPLLRDGLVAATPQFGRNLVQFGHHPLPLRMPVQEELSRSRAPADVREPEEVEGLRRPGEAALVSTIKRIAPEGDEARLFGVQFQPELRESLA